MTAKLVTAWRLHLETLRYTRPTQALHRVRRSLLAWTRIGMPTGTPFRGARLRWQASVSLAADASLTEERRLRADEIVQGRFRFLNRTLAYTDHVSWQGPHPSRLWGFHLHYFGYAIDLACAYRATGNIAYWRRLRSLIDDWINRNPPAPGDAWHPFPISLRVVNWLRAAGMSTDAFRLEPPFEERVLTTLCRQVSYLLRHIEYDVLGNHLVKNAKALIFAGSAIETPDAARWLHRGLHILERELDVQILGDGGHFERSPLYHCQVLEDLLDIIEVLPPGCRILEPLRRCIARMAEFAAELRHRDGSLPLFNDCVLRPTPALDGLLARGRTSVVQTAPCREASSTPAVPSTTAPAPDGREFPDSGYYVLRAGDHVLILDCGAVCPPDVPAHAHCDLLSFELSVGHQRMITNSGTFQYEAGPWRDAFRGTAAHNTVQVEGEEQSAIWDSFRVGRRARIVDVAAESSRDRWYFRGRIVAFHRNRIEHLRELTLLPGPVWVVVDTLRPKNPSETVSICSRLHLAPAVAIAREDGGVRVSQGDASLLILAAGTSLDLGESWFSPDFGVRVPNVVVEARTSGSKILRCGFVIANPHAGVRGARLTGAGERWIVDILTHDGLLKAEAP
jgi:uncharacterized heparinase superfamily protein